MGVKRRAFGGFLAAGLLLGTGLVQAALSEPVDGMVYDDVLDLCWLQDATASGLLTWEDAVTWAQDLVFGGHSDWRLAQMSTSSFTDTVFDCVAGTEQACIDSGNELGYMYYYNLTPLGDTPPTAFGTDLTGNQEPFTNIPPFIWSGTEFSAISAWGLFADDGAQGIGVKDFSPPQFYGWAVRPGQCRAAPGGAEPVPAVGAWGLGVLGLLLMLLAWARLR